MKIERSAFSKKLKFTVLLLAALGAACCTLCFQLSFVTDFFYKVINHDVGLESAIFYHLFACIFTFFASLFVWLLYGKNMLTATKILMIAGSLLMLIVLFAVENPPDIVAWAFILITVAEMVFIIIDIVRNIKNKNF